MQPDHSKKVIKRSYRQIILDFIQDHYEVSPKEIIIGTAISQQTVHNNLKKLIEQDFITKKGSSLDVVYSIAPKVQASEEDDFDFDSFLNSVNEIVIEFENIDTAKVQESILYKQVNQFIDATYLYISPDGHIWQGVQGFIQWANRINPKITFKEGVKMMFEYLSTIQKFHKYFGENGLIDATTKFKASFATHNYLDEVYYCDFYSIERFGKTKLGNLMLYGKQSQNKQLIQIACDMVRPLIVDFIKQNKIDAVAFVPPTIDRQLQFMNELATNLHLEIPVIKLKKLVNQVAVQQKTIKTAPDRITNAENIVVEMTNDKYQNVLILDDAVGSGSTFAVVAKKLRLKKVAVGKIFAIAIVGSANGVVDTSKKFDVVNEV
jgi:predicted transcriptional regulator